MVAAVWLKWLGFWDILKVELIIFAEGLDVEYAGGKKEVKEISKVFGWSNQQINLTLKKEVWKIRRRRGEDKS